VWTPPPDYKAHIAVTESLTSVDTDTEPETDLKLETIETISQALTDSDTISVDLADASAETPDTVESIKTETAITDCDTVNLTATADSDTVSINLGEPATESVAASDTVSDTINLATTPAPPESVSAPVGVPSAASHPVYASHPPHAPLPPPLPVVVNSDSEDEMAEAQSSTQFAPQKFKGLINENAKDWIRQFENYC